MQHVFVIASLNWVGHCWIGVWPPEGLSQDGLTLGPLDLPFPSSKRSEKKCPQMGSRKGIEASSWKASRSPALNRQNPLPLHVIPPWDMSRFPFLISIFSFVK